MRSGSFVVRIELVVPESTFAASSQRIMNVLLYSLDGSRCGTLEKSAPPPSSNAYPGRDTFLP
jgi:hypothetical protein